jgi:hypothetical protein
VVLLLLRLLLELRPGEEILPADDYNQRQYDRKDGVFVLVHSKLGHWRNSPSGARRCSLGNLLTGIM